MENNAVNRRSFVDVRRKSLLFDKMFSEGNEDCSSKGNPKLSMEAYLESLKEERLQWKDILKVRLKKLELLKNNCTYEAMEITASEIEPFLSEEDKSFLSDAPDYLAMMACANRYLEAVDFFKRYKSDVIEYYDELVEEIEKDTDMLVEYLCQDEICELCNQINCTDPDHKIPTN